MMIDTVARLLDLLPHREFVAAPQSRRRTVRGFSTDSRSLKKGEVFIALAGENFDGHDFLERAAERGASAAVVAETWYAVVSVPSVSLPLIVVEDTLASYGMIATAHRNRFTCPVIAVAGSNGKTTTKELIADVLAMRYTTLRTEGNLNNLIGVPAMMLKMTEEHQVAVIEIGTNAPGEIERLCAILRPTHGLITNIGREHLELLGSIEGVAHEEGALFRYLDAEGGLAFVNLDDPHVARRAKPLKRTLTYGRRAVADIHGEFGKLDEFGAPSITVHDRRDPAGLRAPIRAQLRMPGAHAAVNALAAVAVGLALRVPPSKIRRTLESFSPLLYGGGYARLAMMRGANGGAILNDTYNANPDSVATALATLKALKPGRGGRRIAVLADMKELGESSAAEHARVGEEIVAMGKIDLVLFHGAEMRRAHEVIAAASTRTVARHFDRKKDLTGVLLDTVRPEDVVLVKGSRGMKMEDVVRALIQGDAAE